MVDPLRRLAELPAVTRKEFLASLTAAELDELERLSEPLMDFIPRVSPNLVAPRHLAPLVDLLERSETEPIRAVISTPPQHGKTEVGLHALVKQLRRSSSKRHAYITYAGDRAEAMSAKSRQIGFTAGLKIGGTLKLWKTRQGGGAVWTGIGGPLTGYGVDGLMLVDDPVKNRAEAESAIYRERTDQWFRDVALTRVHPSGSVVVVQTRWHEDDLAGRLVKRGWQCINLEAVDGSGKALWPEQRPADWLEKVRAEIGEYAWWSLYMGAPRPRGGALFGDVTLYDDPPKLNKGFRVGIGVDLAYSKKTRADWSVAVTLMRVQNEDPAIPPLFYVLDVRREQVRAPVFKGTLRTLSTSHPEAAMRWYAAGAEAGVGDFLALAEGDLDGLPMEVLTATQDKFVRAQPVAAAWNGGRILVPRRARWAGDFIGEVTTFTGVNDVHDDQVDALSAAYDLLQPDSDGELLERRLKWFRNQ